MQVNIKNLIDDVRWYDTVRELRWPAGREGPLCESKRVMTRGGDDKEPARHGYECHAGEKRFDDLTGPIFAGHHHPRQVWIVCLYCRGLHGSHVQIAKELDLDRSEVPQMRTQLREGSVKNRPT